jgi:hypothetical protein
MALPQFAVAGSDLPIQAKSHFFWQRGVGGRTVRIWTGLYGDMIARMPGWKVDYDEIQLTPDENSPLIRAELILNEPEPEIIWEVIPTMAELDILETSVAWSLQKFDWINETAGDTAPVGGRVVQLWAKLKAVIQDPDLKTFTFSVNNVVPHTPGDSLLLPNGQLAYDVAERLAFLGISGHRALPRYLPCLRLTQTVTSRYDQKLGVTFAGAVLSTATLFALESVPSDVLFSFPSNPVVRDGFIWGWLKGAPSVRRTGRGYWSLQQDWQFGEYPSNPAGLFTFIP